MKPASRIGDITTGHGPFAPRPSISGASTVFVNGVPAMNMNSQFPPHCVGPSCHPGVMAGGSGTVFIEGAPAARMGDMVNCGEQMAIGSGNVLIGD